MAKESSLNQKEMVIEEILKLQKGRKNIEWVKIGVNIINLMDLQMPHSLLMQKI